jgi:hypothetical protein
MLLVRVNCWPGRWRCAPGVGTAGGQRCARGQRRDFALALALGDAAAGGGPGRPMMGLAEHHDGVQGPMQLPVPATVAAMADHLAGRGLDRGRPSQHRNGGLRAESARMRPPDQQLGGADGSDPGLGQQGRRHDQDELAQFHLQLLGVLPGGQDPLRGQGQRSHGGPVLHRIGGRATSPAQAPTCWRRGGPAGCPAAARGGDDQGLPAGGERPPRPPRWRPGWCATPPAPPGARAGAGWPGGRGPGLGGRPGSRPGRRSWPRCGRGAALGRPITVHPPWPWSTRNLVSPAPSQPVPSSAHTRRPGACSPASRSSRA